MPGSGGSYLAIKKWEIDVMIAMGMTEGEYSRLPLEERARKVVAHKLSDWMQILQDNEWRKKRNSK